MKEPNRPKNRKTPDMKITKQEFFLYVIILFTLFAISFIIGY